MFDIITVGDILIDTHIHIDDAALECDLQHNNCKLCFDYGSKIPITESFQALGGNAPNVAIALKKLGTKANIISTVGNDENGKIALDKINNFKIDTSNIFIDKKNETRYSVILNFKGERTILSYSQKKNYNWPKKFPKTNWIYYTSLSDGFQKLHKNLKKYLNENKNVKLAMNPGSFMIKYALKELRESVSMCNLVIVNKQEAEKILKIKSSNSIPNLIKGLIKMGAKEVAITDGKEKAWAGNNKEIWHIKPFPAKSISKTGAGDAFSAGYLVAKINKKEIPECLRWGVANSSGVIEKVGAQNGILNKKEIMKKIKKYNKNKPKKYL